MAPASPLLLAAALFLQDPDPSRRPVRAGAPFALSAPIPGVEAPDPDPLADPYPKWAAGFRIDVWTGFGSVMNDIVGPSVHVTYRLTDRWAVSASLFKSDFDFEDPADHLFGRSGTPVSDASIDLFILRASAEWHFLEPRGRLDLYAAAGLGLVMPGDGEAVAQPQVNIEVSGNSGFEVHFALGGSYRIVERLYANVELRIMQSFNSFDARDRITGEEDSLNSWGAIGIALGLEWRF
jgi:hypothetical protein